MATFRVPANQEREMMTEGGEGLCESGKAISEVSSFEQGRIRGSSPWETGNGLRGGRMEKEELHQAGE